MTPDEVRAAIEVGIEVAEHFVQEGNRLLVTGDLGIGNTTASAALVSVFTGRDAAEVTGRGAGSDDTMLVHKVEVVRRGIAHNGAAPERPLEALAAVGGLEHAGLVGFLLGAAARRTPVLLDGVIACSAALVAQALCPGVTAYLVAGHRSQEPGATAALQHLGLDPPSTSTCGSARVRARSLRYRSSRRRRGFCARWLPSTRLALATSPSVRASGCPGAQVRGRKGWPRAQSTTGTSVRRARWTTRSRLTSTSSGRSCRMRARRGLRSLSGRMR